MYNNKITKQLSTRIKDYVFRYINNLQDFSGYLVKHQHSDEQAVTEMKVCMLCVYASASLSTTMKYSNSATMSG